MEGVDGEQTGESECTTDVGLITLIKQHKFTKALECISTIQQ